MEKLLKHPSLPQLIKSKASSSRFNSRALDSSISSLADRFKDTKTKGKFSLDILDKKEASYSIHLQGKNTKVCKGHNEAAELHICTTWKTWMEIASGQLPPAVAYLKGNMSVSGQLGFIKRVYALAAKQNHLDNFII